MIGQGTAILRERKGAEVRRMQKEGVRTRGGESDRRGIVRDTRRDACTSQTHAEGGRQGEGGMQKSDAGKVRCMQKVGDRARGGGATIEAAWGRQTRQMHADGGRQDEREDAEVRCMQKPDACRSQHPFSHHVPVTPQVRLAPSPGHCVLSHTPEKAKHAANKFDEIV